VNNNSKLSYHQKESTVSSICEREHSSVSHPKIRVLIIDASSVNHVDVTAIRMLRGLAKRLEEHDMIMLFANWKGPMRGYLEKAHFYDTIPPDHCFLSIHDAVLWAEVFYLHRNPSYVQDAR
jgi:MFS superfamily sulfate permease-like transporter